MVESIAGAIQDPVTKWIAEAHVKLTDGLFSAADLDRLLILHRQSTGQLRQRILYLHAGTPSIYSKVISAAEHSPVSDSIAEIDPLAPQSPFSSVHDAIVAGWRVIHFPQQLAPFEDREIDIMGYEFILEKLEIYHDSI
ncbi:MAG: hypothetical protein HOH43_15205 [Candidatus Latescibacteria bacterium]|nr:hypothetical protein [Candidatus Latescibacterota bacterium]